MQKSERRGGREKKRLNYLSSLIARCTCSGKEPTSEKTRITPYQAECEINLLLTIENRTAGDAARIGSQ
jgi:hypothetical protein